MDALLGSPRSAWEGGVRVADIDGRTSERGHEARAQRHLLLPALHALQERAGWISPGGMNYVCARLDVPPADAYGVATFYALFSVEPRPARVLHVCDDIACMCAGSTELIELLEQRAVAGGRVAGGRRGVVEEPVPRSVRPRAGRAADRRRRGAERDGARAGRHRHRARRRLDGDPVRAADVPAARRRPASRGCGCCAASAASQPDEPRRLPRRGRLRRAAARASSSAPAAVDPRGQGVRARRPRRRRVPHGRQVGGRRARARPAALPRLQRRRVRARHVQGPRADRGRPLRGDRVDDDRRVRERLRARLHLPARRVPGAQRDPHPRDGPARRHGLLGRDILGRGFDFDIEIRKGAGAYICGEETAIFNSIEGFRGEPRNKPPFPTQVGLFGKPTIVNNIETLVNVLDIVLEGGRAFAEIGTEKSTGPKLFCVSGSRGAARRLRGRRSGITLRELIELAGGVPGGRSAPDGAARRRGRQLRRPGPARRAADVRGGARRRRRRSARAW